MILNLFIYASLWLFTWKGNCFYSFTDVLVAVAINIQNKVSFNIECFKIFLPFSSIPFIISVIQGSRLLKKKITAFDSRNYLNM